MPHTLEQLRHLTPRALPLAIAAALLAPCSSAWADGLQVLDAIAVKPNIHTEQNVPVIDIVAPNASGLSHNFYSEYNVGAQGVVLNNSLADGHSELAGALQANPHLDGTAASTILNEVVGHNRSNINGPQVVFGAAADYVLANPNGIMLNGASLANVPRATFVVGSPSLLDGQLSQLDTQAAKGVLRVENNGVSNPGGSLALIAPSIGSNGSIRAGGDIDLVLGSNVVDYADHSVASNTRMPKRIDANLLGAMDSAGRIRILSTHEGAGIKMPGIQLTANKGISLSAAGDINLQGKSTADAPTVQARIDAGSGELKIDSTQLLNLADTHLRSQGDIALRAQTLRTEGVNAVAEGALRINASSVKNGADQGAVSRYRGQEVTVSVDGNINDVGTAYVSITGMTRIRAQNHDLKAAADKSVEGTSLATVGAIAGAGGIDIQLKNDGHYEGTSFSSTQGPITLNAGGALSLNQASDHKQSVDDRGTVNKRQAIVARLDTPGVVTLASGRDTLLTGVQIGSQEQKVDTLNISAGGTLLNLAAIDKVTATGHQLSTGERGLQMSQTEQDSYRQVHSQWHVANDANLSALARHNQAITLQGTQLDATRIQLETTNGGVQLEAATQRTQADVKTFDIGAPAADSSFKITHYKEDSKTYNNAKLVADAIKIDTRGQLRLNGAEIEARAITGNVGANLVIASRSDDVKVLNVDGQAQLGGKVSPNALPGEAALLAGKWNTPATDALKAYGSAGTGSLIEQGSFDFKRTDRQGIAQLSSMSAVEGVNLKVSGVVDQAQEAQGVNELQTHSLVKVRDGNLDIAKRVYGQMRLR
jgi:filamentous hemagglutinin family protein